ncbi:MAG: hypothetical protein V1664_05135 [Candidatus Uhrbacteria bacterium]
MLEFESVGELSFEQMKNLVGTEVTFAVPEHTLEEHMGRGLAEKDFEAIRKFPRLRGKIEKHKMDEKAVRISAGVRIDGSGQTGWSPIFRTDEDVKFWDVKLV